MNYKSLLLLVAAQILLAAKANALCVGGVGRSCTNNATSLEEEHSRSAALENLADFGGVASACKTKQVHLSRNLEAHVIKRIEELASSALILELEEAMTKGLSEEIEPISAGDLKNLDWVYSTPENVGSPKVIKLVGERLSEEEELGLQVDVDTNGQPIRVSKLSTNIKDIMMLAPLTNISLEDRELGTVIIHSNELSVKNVKVGRLFAKVSGTGDLVNIEAEDVVWTANGTGTSLSVQNMKADRISIVLNGTGSTLDIDGLTSRSANIQLHGTGTFANLRKMNVKDFNYNNTGTGSFTRISNSNFQNMRLFNDGTGGAMHLFGVTANVGLINNTSTGADIYLDDVKGGNILFAHSDGTGGAIVGNQIRYPVLQISNASTGSIIFLNDVISDLLVTCNNGTASSSAEFLSDYQALKGMPYNHVFSSPPEDFKGYKVYVPRPRHRHHGYERSESLEYDGYMEIASKMPAGDSYSTHIENLDTKVFITLDGRPLKAVGKTEILIAPRGMQVDGLEFNHRIDF